MAMAMPLSDCQRRYQLQCLLSTKFIKRRVNMFRRVIVIAHQKRREHVMISGLTLEEANADAVALGSTRFTNMKYWHLTTRLGDYL